MNIASPTAEIENRPSEKWELKNNAKDQNIHSI